MRKQFLPECAARALYAAVAYIRAAAARAAVPVRQVCDELASSAAGAAWPA